MKHTLVKQAVTFTKKVWRYTNCCNVRDYYDYTSKYRGAAHNICNLKYSIHKENQAFQFQ